MAADTPVAARAPASALPIQHHRAFVFVASIALAAVLFVPYLGAVGLWDPWETHYSEVGREMLTRNDLIHPYWQDAWFFSKPALTLWLAALGLFIAGAGSGTGELPLITEWCIRLPFALLSMLAIGVLAHHVSRLVSRRAGLLSALVLSTAPMWFFVSRQAMTDMPFVSMASVSAMSFIRVLLDDKASKWWLDVAWVAAGVATLGKGLLGIGLPIAITGLTVLLDAKSVGEVWLKVRALTTFRGLVGFGLVALPWYVAMLNFSAVDNEGKTFFQRFFIHDHFARLTSGVFTTTPNTTFAYFIEQGAYGFFPWVGVVPLAAARLLRDGPSSTRRLERAMGAWAVFSFGLFTLSATKFHHYCLPMLPALAVLVAIALDDVLERAEAAAPAMMVLGAVVLLVVGRDLAKSPRKWIELFTYNHERPYPDVIDSLPIFNGAPRWLDSHHMAWLLTFIGVSALFLLIRTPLWAPWPRQRLVAALAVTALSCTMWQSWSHWVDLAHHWTQRDLFWRYWRQHRGDEPIAAFYMDWKGETFYSRNSVLQLGPANWQRDLPTFLNRSGRKWMLVEHDRLRWLTQSIGPSHTTQSIEPALNNKFVLVLVDG